MKLAHIKILDELGLSDNQVDSLLMERIYGLEGMDRDAIIKYYMTLAAKKGERYFISFRGLKKDEPERLRMNYKAEYDSTPMGVYAYPLDKATYECPEYNGFKNGYMMGTQGRFVVLKLNEQTPAVIIGENGEEYINCDINDIYNKASKVIQQLHSESPYQSRIRIRHINSTNTTIEYADVGNIIEFFKQNLGLEKFKYFIEHNLNDAKLATQPFKLIYRLIIEGAKTIGRQNLLLRYIGVHAVVDYDETVHSNEPIQAFFLTANSFTQMSEDNNKRKFPYGIDSKSSDRAKANFRESFNGDAFAMLTTYFDRKTAISVVKELNYLIRVYDDVQMVPFHLFAKVIEDMLYSHGRRTLLMTQTDEFKQFVGKRVSESKGVADFNSTSFMERAQAFDLLIKASPELMKMFESFVSEINMSNRIRLVSDIVSSGGLSGGVDTELFSVVSETESFGILKNSVMGWLGAFELNDPDMWLELTDSELSPVFLEMFAKSTGQGNSLAELFGNVFDPGIYESYEAAINNTLDVGARIELCKGLLEIIKKNPYNKPAPATFLNCYGTRLMFRECIADNPNEIPFWMLLEYRKQTYLLKYETHTYWANDFLGNPLGLVNFDKVIPDFGEYNSYLQAMINGKVIDIFFGQLFYRWFTHISTNVLVHNYDSVYAEIKKLIFNNKLTTESFDIILEYLYKISNDTTLKALLEEKTKKSITNKLYGGGDYFDMGSGK